MVLVYILASLLVGLTVGWILTIFLKKQNNNSDSQEYKSQEEMIRIQERCRMFEQENTELKQNYKDLEQKEKEFIKTSTRLQTENESKQREIEQQKKSLEEMSQRLKTEFENMANKIFTQTTTNFKKESKDSLEAMLNPLKDNIVTFQKSVHSLEGQEKSFQEAFKDLQSMNQQMRDSSRSLTDALQGSSKAQGNWGEFLLENILEKSGLRKGEEYIIQGKDMDLTGQTGHASKPDVIVNLPDGKHIVIDSKTSVENYIQYESEKDKDKKADYKKKVIGSLSNHIKSLASKKYNHLDNLKTPDFVLMFIPVEPVFCLAVQDKALFDKAWDQNIVIVSPITLYASLKTIASIWKIERQNKNAEEIAKASGLLYDKFCGFLEDMDKIDKGIKTISGSYDSAVNKLKSGKGNLIQKVEHIKDLGAKTNKQIPSNFQQD